MSLEQQSAGNLLVRSFSEEAFARLRPHFERVKLIRGEVLTHNGEAPAHVFFPEGGVVSIVIALARDEAPTEIGMFGREGASSLPALLGVESTTYRTIVQVNHHTALKIAVEPLREAMEDDRELRALLLRYVYVMMHQVTMSATAYANHQLEARLSRWLVMCCDRVDGTELELTHEFMANMLGARRSSVTVTLHVLEGMGAIRSTRGLVLIRDRAKLEELAGDTYGSTESEYARLIGEFRTGADGGVSKRA